MAPPDGPDPTLGELYEAVAAGESAHEVRLLIEAYASGSRARRARAANAAAGDDDETVLQAAHRLGRGDLVGLLLEEGADPENLFGNPNTHALAVCIAYGRPRSLRALLCSGRHEADERLCYGPDTAVEGAGTEEKFLKCSAAHLCLVPPRLCDDTLSDENDEDAVVALPPPRFRCLKVVLRHGGAALLGARDQLGKTPLAWLCEWRDDDPDALESFLKMAPDVDVNARDLRGRTPLMELAPRAGIEVLQLLLERGASADAIDVDGNTPLTEACQCRGLLASDRDVVEELLRRSSRQTRRAVLRQDGRSAVDCIVDVRGAALLRWHERVIARLLASGAPVLPRNADVVLPIAESRGLRIAERCERESAALRSELQGWRGHDAMVGLALDARDAREAEEAVEAAERRVAALEAAERRVAALEAAL